MIYKVSWTVNSSLVSLNSKTKPKKTYKTIK